MEITDDMCRLAISVWAQERIQGFSTPIGHNKWGAPHYIRDVWLAPEKQVIWRGDSHDEMMDRVEVEKMRLALYAAMTGAVVHVEAKE